MTPVNTECVYGGQHGSCPVPEASGCHRRGWAQQGYTIPQAHSTSNATPHKADCPVHCVPWPSTMQHLQMASKPLFDLGDTQEGWEVGMIQKFYPCGQWKNRGGREGASLGHLWGSSYLSPAWLVQDSRGIP